MTDKAHIIKERYVISGEPRIGRLADVYPAFDIQNNGLKVALKLFRTGMPNDEVIKEAFQRESLRLMDLKHHSIISMRDYGETCELKRPFLVLDWGGDPLEEWFESGHRPKTWNEYYGIMGQALLEAIAFAHTRQTIHRELKPSDYLRDENGVIRLADFGVSKFPNFLDQKLNIEDFLNDNEPFSPPNGYDPSYSATTDVYGFVAVSLYFLSGKKFNQWTQVDEIVNGVRASSAVREILFDSLSENPAERPIDAHILYERLEKASRLEQRITVRPYNYLGLTNKGLETIRQNLPGVETRNEAEVAILNDLNAICAIKRFRERDRKIRFGHYWIYGETLMIHAAVDDRNKANLTILSVKRNSSHDSHDSYRSQAWESTYQFTFTPAPNPIIGNKVIMQLAEYVETYENEEESRKKQQEEDQLFWCWQNLINLRKSHATQGLRYDYKSVETDGNRVSFHLIQSPDPTIIEEVWGIEGSSFTGVVDEVKDKVVTLYIEGGRVSKIRKTGVVCIDASATTSQLNKQTNALIALRSAKTPQLDTLKRRLLHPSDSETYANISPIKRWNIDQLDETKKDAVQRALAAKDLFVVEGPPGTGKTTFISELILQFLERYPNERVLVTSQTHIAVDNAIERVSTLKPDLKLIRIGREEKVGEDVRCYILENRIKDWQAEVRQKSTQFLKDKAEADGVDTNKIQTGLDAGVILRLKRLLATAEASERKRETERLELKLRINEKLPTGAHKLDADDRDRAEEELQRIEDDLRDLQRLIKERRSALGRASAVFQIDHEEYADLIEFSPDDLQEWQDDLVGDSRDAQQILNLYKLSQEWSTRFALRRDCQDALLMTSDIVAGTCIGTAISGEDSDYGLCILDEASKASFSEAVVPLALSKKWVLVGDQQQLPPFADAVLRDRESLKIKDIDYDIVAETLLARLERLQLPEHSKSMLREQHRMVPALGDLISHIFYSGKLKNVRDPKRPRPIELTFEKPVTWISTENENERGESKSKQFSYMNLVEADWVATLVDRIEFWADTNKTEDPITIAIVTGYSAQRQQIERRLSQKQLKFVEYECNTVDAYQGREADFVIFSVTRSNSYQSPGFLCEQQRINVALSRGKYGLCIVGDAKFCRELGSSTRLSEVLDYIETNSEDCAIKRGVL